MRSTSGSAELPRSGRSHIEERKKSLLGADSRPGPSVGVVVVVAAAAAAAIVVVVVVLVVGGGGADVAVAEVVARPGALIKPRPAPLAGQFSTKSAQICLRSALRTHSLAGH